VTRVPVALSGLPALRLASADSMASDEGYLQFTVPTACRVYVAHDVRAANVPDWLRAFRREGAPVEVDDWGTTLVYQLYSKEFPAGRVVLGGNQAGGYRGGVTLNYLLFVCPRA